MMDYKKGDRILFPNGRRYQMACKPYIIDVLGVPMQFVRFRGLRGEYNIGWVMDQPKVDDEM